MIQVINAKLVISLKKSRIRLRPGYWTRAVIFATFNSFCHTYLDTTTIYTHVSIAKLKEVHPKTHPTAKYEKYLPVRIPANKLKA